MRGLVASAFFASVLSTPSARSDVSLPPWNDPNDVPLPTWARSVVVRREDTPVFVGPNVAEPKRGALLGGVTLPLFGVKRGPGCSGRWFLIGPLAWVCSDAADLSDHPVSREPGNSGPELEHYFVGPDGANGYLDLERAEDEAPDQEFDPGFSVAVEEKRSAHGEPWGKTHHGLWVAMRELAPAHPSNFHGERVTERLDFAWVIPERANVYATVDPRAKSVTTRVRFQVVPWREEQIATSTRMVRISEDGAPSAEWMRLRDLARPTLAQPPDEIGGPNATERWIDVDLGSETLVAYEGVRPVFATLISGGRGPAGSDSATPTGVHRLWIKLISTNMDNLEREDDEHHFLIEDVPYVQFFDRAVALHGAFWHHDFGLPRSHGCVNLSPPDAKWLFSWTSPHLPAGFGAALPMRYEKGTLIRIR